MHFAGLECIKFSDKTKSAKFSVLLNLVILR